MKKSILISLLAFSSCALASDPSRRPVLSENAKTILSVVRCYSAGAPYAALLERDLDSLTREEGETVTAAILEIYTLNVGRIIQRQPAFLNYIRRVHNPVRVLNALAVELFRQHEADKAAA